MEEHWPSEIELTQDEIREAIAEAIRKKTEGAIHVEIESLTFHASA